MVFLLYRYESQGPMDTIQTTALVTVLTADLTSCSGLSGHTVAALINLNRDIKDLFSVLAKCV